MFELFRGVAERRTGARLAVRAQVQGVVILEAVVDAEATAAGDAEAALRGIDAAVTAAIARGVGDFEVLAEMVRSEATDDQEDEE